MNKVTELRKLQEELLKLKDKLFIHSSCVTERFLKSAPKHQGQGGILKEESWAGDIGPHSDLDYSLMPPLKGRPLPTP